MIGRKKDTLLLMIVIMMSFFFSILAIILQGSFQKTRAAHRLQLYGAWHAAYLSADDDIYKQLKSEPGISSIGKSYLINASTNLGNIGTFNQELIEMGKLNLLEGSFPSKPGEIAIESSKLAELGLNDPIGKEINISLEFILHKASQEELDNYRNKFYEQLMKEFKSGNLSLEEYGIYFDENDTETDKELILKDFITWLIKEYKHRTVEWEYPADNVSLTFSNLYYISFREGDAPDPEIIIKEGILEDSILRLNLTYTVCGVIADYSERWDASYYPLANALISEDGYKELESIIKNTSLTDTSDFDVANKLNLFLYSQALATGLYDKLAPKFLTQELIGQVSDYEGYGELSDAVSAYNVNFRKNSFAYPIMEGSTEATLLLAILTIIFIATIVSVFQIFLSQIKKRSRKIALLKSIGATNGQIISMMTWEGVYILLICLPAGELLGAGMSYLVLQLISASKGQEVVFYADFKLVALGIVTGVLAVIVGMIVPIVYATGTPLIGTMSKPPKHNTEKYRKRLLAKQKKSAKRHSFRTVTLRHISLNKGKTLLNLAISAITVSILIISVFMCYMSFEDYFTTVAIPNRPDYTLEIPYGVNEIYITRYSKLIKRIPGIKNVEGYRRGEYLHLYSDNLEQDETIDAFYKLIPDYLAKEHFAPEFGDGKVTAVSYGDPSVDKAFLVNMYGVKIDSDFGKSIIGSITEGSVDKEAFEQGREVILLMPMYKKGKADISSLKSFEDVNLINDMSKYARMKWLLEKEGAYGLSLSRRYRDTYEKNETIKVGDTIIISADEEVQVGDNIVSEYTPREVKVAGIISYFPGNSVWPFYDTSESYAVIASSQLFENVYKSASGAVYTRQDSAYIEMVTSLFKSKFGKTVFNIYGDSTADRVNTDIQMIEFAADLNARLYSYRESNQMLYTSALNNALIIGILGFATSVIALFILFNVLTSMARQEKHRTGILQSIGVTNRQLRGLQISTGFIFSLISLAAAHIILILIMLLTPFGTTSSVNFTIAEYFKDIFGKLIFYPWTLHVVVCIVYTVVTVLIYYISAKNIIRQSPVENMRV